MVGAPISPTELRSLPRGKAARPSNCNSMYLMTTRPCLHSARSTTWPPSTAAPLAMGLLTGKYTAETKPSADDVRGEKSPEWMKYFTEGKPNPEWLAKRDAIREILTSNERTVAQGALAWLWARSPQTIPIPGFRTVKQVEENTRAMDFGPLRPEQMREIAKLLER